METISDLFSRLRTDDWRAETGFSAEMESANQAMFEARSVEGISEALRVWLQKYQPCLFGRLAAKLNLLSFCILTEEDFVRGDNTVRDKIQDARSTWTREGFEGRKSGFIVLAVAPKLANAVPDKTLEQLALRLSSLHLLDEVQPDKIYLDQIFLEKPGSHKTTWQWLAGVNVFAAAGDGRWWQDHRIPGGLGFSVNSVGHMVKSGMLARQMQEMDRILGGSPESLVTSKIESLEEALEFAMRTIALASNAASGRATELLPLPDDTSRLPVSRCPVKLPRFLADKNYCEYLGYYHTDVTVPSEYFSPDITRPTGTKALTLDFTYLFNSDLENPAFHTMGAGRRVRGAGEMSPLDKRSKGEPTTVKIKSIPRLAVLPERSK